jgi:hypothetical protein
MYKCPSRYNILDFVWPVIEPLNPEAAVAYAKRRNEEQEAALSHINNLTDTDGGLDSAIPSLESLLSNEQERRQSVQTRLAGTLGFATVAATIGLGVASGAIVDARANFQLSVRIIVGLLAFYVVIQILHVCLSSIRGLSRAGYLSVSLGDVLSRHTETSIDRKRRYLQTLVKVLLDHQELNNRKVEAMALAHTSARNYIVGIAVFTLVALCIHVLAVPQTSMEQVIRELRSDSKLQELLRGPRGDVGPMGPAGPPGVAGPIGPAGQAYQSEPQRPSTNLLKKHPKNRVSKRKRTK